MRGRTRLAWLASAVAAAVVAVAAMVASRLVSAPILTWDVAWTAAALSAVLACGLAWRGARDESRSRWATWTLSLGFWLGGQVAWNSYGAHAPASPNLGDVGWWCFAVCATLGVMRHRSRSRSLRLVALVETVPLIAAALSLTTALLWHSFTVSSLSPASKIAIMVYPALYVSAAIVTLQALLGGWLRGHSPGAARLILAGIGIQALTFTFWSERLLDQSYVQGATMLDPAFVIGLLAIAAGGVWAASTPAAADTGAGSPGRGGLLPGAVFALLSSVLLHAQLSRAPQLPRVALACGLVCSGGALILRSWLLSRRLHQLLERERGTVADLAERESDLARVNRRLVEDSRHDALTGMRNRRALAYDLPRIESVHRRQDEPFAIVVVDVDHFKAYNDRLGHLAGDQALRSLTAIIRSELRDCDIGYRFGGEELLVVLMGTGAQDALRTAERLRLAVRAAGLPHPDGIDRILTVSMGVACGRENASDVLARADACLYAAKRAGRDRVSADAGQDLGARRPLPDADGESAPRQLRGMLTIARAAASGAGVAPVLQTVAEVIRSELAFRVVAVNVRDRVRDVIEVAVVLGDDEAREALLGTSSPWSALARLIRPEHERRGALWLPAGSDIGAITTWDPALGEDDVDDPDAWQSEDMLLLPVRNSTGEILAVVSVDDPLSGRRPEDDELSMLMAVADHAGVALERAQREAERSLATDERSSERLEAVLLLAETLDLRDPGTGRHSRTVGDYARRTAIALDLSPEHVRRVQAAGVLHDLGKLGVADAVLYKPGPLDDAEWREVKRHPEVGARILEHAGLLDLAPWVRSHHERVDGRGYPSGLSDGAIPLEAKILAVADAYEAMTADRPYRAGVGAAEAEAELRRCVGSQFDDRVVEAFLAALAAGGEAIDGALAVAAS
jgi:diguanylate cyclase (GGDEF)-like protein